jgi:hypothetical protein
MNFITLKPTDLENHEWTSKPIEIFSRFNHPEFNLKELIKESLDNVKMEGWGAWIGVKKSIEVSELEQYVFIREWDNFSQVNNNSYHPITVEKLGVYAHLGFSNKTDEGKYFISIELYIKNK